MVILGLGSNVGDRLAQLHRAMHEIKKIPGVTLQQISPVYLSDALLPDNAPPEWDMPHLNLALRCETQLEPLDLLKQLKNIEYSIGRKPEVRHWGPRIIDIDILAWDDRIIKTEALTVPHENLQDRPFALWPLADIAPLWIFPLAGPNQGKTAEQIAEKWGSRFSGEAPLHTQQIYQRVDTPQLMGVLNITTNSFSDGGQFLQPEAALQQAIKLVADGANIVDIGAESTAPSTTPLEPHQEWQRLEPILEAIKAAKDQFLIFPKISVDTRHPEVAAKALKFGVDWINDVTGLQSTTMQELVAQANVDCVMMHHMSIPASAKHIVPREKDPVKFIHAWALEQIKLLEKAGIKRERIIFDPGIGFGKMAEQSLVLLRNLAAFTDLGTRILVGHSRKSFLSLFTAEPAAKRDVETLALNIFLANQPIDYMRVHNVEWCSRALRVNKAL